jgi:hypothetical protein
MKTISYDKFQQVFNSPGYIGYSNFSHDGARCAVAKLDRLIDSPAFNGVYSCNIIGDRELKNLGFEHDFAVFAELTNNSIDLTRKLSLNVIYEILNQLNISRVIPKDGSKVRQIHENYVKAVLQRAEELGIIKIEDEMSAQFSLVKCVEPELVPVA